MKINYTVAQQLIARILLLSLLLQSCGGGFNNNPIIPTREEEITSVQTGRGEIISPTNIHPLIDQKLTAQGGHEVTFYEEEGQLKADVEMNAPQGFSKTYESLNVAVEQGVDVAILPRLDAEAQKHRIHLQLAKGNQRATVVIYKGAGLAGGMLEGEEEALGDEQEDSIPNECFCPITQEIMEDPVIAQDGHTYERQAIKRWLDMGKRISPKTGARLLTTELTPNHTMRSLIQDIKAQVPVLARHKVDMHNIEAALKLREEEVEEKLIQKGSFLEKESQQRLRLEGELQQKMALLSVVEKERSNHPRLSQHPLPTPQPEKLTDKREIRKYFFKGMLEITPKNYQVLLKHSLSSEDAFHAYDKGLLIKGWPVSMGMDSLIDLLMAFSRITRLKVDINWDQAGQEEEVTAAIARSLQFYEQLACLELSGCHLNDISWQEIVACMAEPACLKELDIRENLLTEEAIKNISGCFPNLTKLEHDVKGEVLPEVTGQGHVTSQPNSQTITPDTRTSDFLQVQMAERGSELLKANTPSERECKTGNLEISELPIYKGADVNAKSSFGNSRLHIVCMKGDLAAVKLLVEKGADVNDKHKYGYTPLYCACRNGHLEVVKYLVDQGADINDNTPLHEALKSGNLEVLEFLISKGADINDKDRIGNTLLQTALKSGNLEVSEFLISKGADVNDKDRIGNTLLQTAIESGNLEVSEFLISKGADVNDKDRIGNTLLQTAIESGNLEVSEFLISKGADVNAKDGIGNTLLQTAIGEGNLEITEFLISKGADINATDQYGNTLLQVAIKLGKLEVSEFLISKGADINTVDYDGNTPLDVAIKLGKLEVSEFLISKGADINTVDYDGNTPLDVAIKLGNLEVLKLLISKGADINTTDQYGNTLLQVAIKVGKLEVSEFLISKGADIDTVDNDGNTPSHWAAIKGQLQIFDLLLKKGANVNAKDNDGYTPLHSAIIYGKLEVSEFLISKGADINAKDNDGNTPLHFAALEGQLQISKLLIDKGSSIEAKNKDGNTAIYLAIEKGYSEIANMLLKHAAEINIKKDEGDRTISKSSITESPKEQQSHRRIFRGRRRGGH